MHKHPSRSLDMRDLGVLDLLTPSTQQLVHSLDAETYSHCCRLSLLSKKFSSFLQLSNQETRFLVLGAYFHDIGKVFISHNILNKPTALDLAEWEIMKSHSAIDNSVIGLPTELEAIVPIIQCHHERWDGSGYPYALAKEEIPHLARIVQILDVYDALTHRRSYKTTFSTEEAITIILNETAKGWYQTSLINEIIAFLGFHNPIVKA